MNGRVLATRLLDRIRRRGCFGTLVSVGFFVVAPLSSAQAAVNPVTFAPAVNIAMADPPQGIAAADVTGDGRRDLVVLTEGSRLVTFVASGDGTFVRREPSTLAFGSEDPPSPGSIIGSPGGFGLGDYNSDGVIDAVVASRFRIPCPTCRYGSEVYLYLGDGTGAFHRQDQVPGTNGTYHAFGDAPSPPARGVAAIDVNRDGHTDVAFFDRGGLVGVAYGNGTATFPVVRRVSEQMQHSAAHWADLNQDGAVDLAVIDNFQSAVAISIARPTGFAPPVTVPISGTPDLHGLDTADVDEDGDIDLIVDGFSEISLLSNEGNGSFAGRVVVPVGGGSATSGPPSDLDGDGTLDLVAGNAAFFGFGRAVSVMRASGPGVFGIPDQFPVIGSTAGLLVEDLNADGRPDVVAAGGGTTGGIAILLNTTVFPPPDVTTEAVADVSARRAVATGRVRPRRRAATYRFEYGTTTAYGQSTATVTIAGRTPTRVTANLTSLRPGTTYHARLVASDAFGTTYGSNVTFVTSRQLVALNAPTTRLTWRESTLRGAVIVNGTVDARLDATLTVRAAGRRVAARRTVVLPVGPFSTALRLHPRTPPGRYKLVVSAVDADGNRSTEERTVIIPAAREGYVREAYISRTAGGPRLTRIGGRPTLLFASFTFGVPPARRGSLTAQWIDPRGRIVRPTVRKRYLPTVTSTLRVRSGEPVPRGTWRCLLRSGGIVVARTSVVVT